MKIRVSWCHAEGEEGGEGGKRSVVVIAGMYSHLLFDGSTRNLFMNEWAAVHRKMFDCEVYIFIKHKSITNNIISCMHTKTHT